MSARDWARAIELTQRLRATPEPTLPAIVLDAATARGSAPALIGSDRQFTHAQLAAQANRWARWGLQSNLAHGEVVALLMPNNIDYVTIWLGLTRIGCVVALLNTQLAPPALAHGIGSAAASHVIVGAALCEVASATRALLGTDIAWHVFGAPIPGWEPLDTVIAALDGDALHPAERRPVVATDRALLIFTSGTTGLPKAANVSHARVLEWGAWFAGLIDAKQDDRLYDCLPLYHSTGGVVAIGCMLLAGGAVVIRDRFSASRFWNDVAATRCTIVQYIGELCRYLLHAPPNPGEATHAVRLCCGNGLRADVWPAFQQRFAIPRILEFYAATEGSVSLYNCDGKPGAIGRVPGFLAHRFPVALIRCDADSLVPERDPDGRCVRCQPGEVGEAIGPIGPHASFDGYTDPAATARKILHDVFAPGDRWFRTGDLMRRDAAGYFYFVDRLGDTFRWKGENVSATEVATVLGGCPGVLQAVVYGVAVPGTEGKAGMAAIVAGDGFSLPALRAWLAAHLPAYARPLFIRLCPAIDTTGTFKLRKTDLAQAGYTDTGDDPVWFDDRDAERFVACNDTLRASLAGRKL